MLFKSECQEERPRIFERRKIALCGAKERKRENDEEEEEWERTMSVV